MTAGAAARTANAAPPEAQSSVAARAPEGECRQAGAEAETIVLSGPRSEKRS
jgi:hypothetical protein